MTLQTKIEQALALAEAGDRLVCDLASGKQKWKMCVPPQPDDTDMVLIKLPREVVPALAKALQIAVDELENLTKTDVCDVGRDSFIWLTGWRNDAKASAARRLAEITKILLPEEKARGESMSKKMIVRFVDGYEGRQDLIFEVNKDGVQGLAENLLAYTEFPEDEMPVLKVEMFTEAQLDEANRIGKEMA